MHECPECGEACDCDGEDIWWDYESVAVENCTHWMACDAYEDIDAEAV